MVSTRQDDLFNQAESANTSLTHRSEVSGLEMFRLEQKKVQKHIKKIKAEVERETKIEKLWSQIIRFIEADWHFHLLELSIKEKSLIAAIQADAPELISQLEKQCEISQKLGADKLKVFFRLFPEACRAAGIEPDRSCRHPKYTFNERFLTLELNEKKQEAVLSTYEGRIGKKPADIPALVTWLKKEQERLFSRSFDGEKFLRIIHKAYKTILKKEKKPDGESLPIRKLVKQIKCKGDEANIDLAKLCRLSPPPAIKGWEIDFQQTKDNDNGMLLWKSTGGYVGYITFRKIMKKEEQT